MNFKCLIVDDEPIAQNILKSYINDASGLVLVGVCDNAMEANVALKEQKVDIMFLDIEMPKITGIGFLKTLADAPNVIFTTAYREFALESYDMNAVDYLLKPFSFERFLKAVNKVSLKNRENDSAKYEYFKVDRKNVKVYYKDILYIEGLSNYVIVHTINAKLIIYHKLMDLDKSLPQNEFVRIHKSFIVSLLNIKAYGSDYVEIGDKQLTISNTYRDRFFNAI